MIRECNKCYAWVGTNDPNEEKVFRDCPTCKIPMKLLTGINEEAFKPMAIGKLIPLPKPYAAPKP